MDRRRFLTGLGVSAAAGLLAAGCGAGGDGGNIKEERVISKKDSEDMAKALAEGRKGMNSAHKAK